MNKHVFTSLLIGLAVCIAMVAWLSQPVNAGAAPTATASFMQGTVEAQAAGKTDWKPIAKGDKLGADYCVRTGKDSKLELTLPDGSLLRVAASSQVRLKSLIKGEGKTKRNMNFKVTTGKIWANVNKLVGQDDSFQVNTENAVAGVRGTVFRVDLMEDQATVIKVYSGAVAVSNAPIYQRKADAKGDRVQVPGPQQVTKKKWEELVAKAMKEVRVAADGAMSMNDFTLASDQDDWVKWNQDRDKLAALPHE